MSPAAWNLLELLARCRVEGLLAVQLYYDVIERSRKTVVLILCLCTDGAGKVRLLTRFGSPICHHCYDHALARILHGKNPQQSIGL